MRQGNSGETMLRVVIVGGGTAGISTAAYLRRKLKDINISLIEPSSVHYYQPLWTLAGGGILDKKVTKKKTAKLIPKNVNWIQDKVVGFKLDTNKIVTASGAEVYYDYLIIAPGIQIDWNRIKGLQSSIGKDGVCSNYDYEYVDKTWESIQNTKKGSALFTFPNTPIKCGGAPQKIMYLAEEYFRKNGVREDVDVEFVSAGERIFGVTKYREALEKIIKERRISTHYRLNLEKIDGANKIAYFRNLDTNEVVEKHYTMIHVVPPMSAPDFIKTSALANNDGWVDVDKYTLQHNRYPNIFGLGDASSLPTAKTGASIRKEIPVLVHNLIRLIEGRSLDAKYNGYASCPIVTGRGKLILAEFDYDGKPVETFPWDQSKESFLLYLLKKYGLPRLYWWFMLKGWM